MYVWVNSLAPWGVLHLRHSDVKRSQKIKNKHKNTTTNIRLQLLYFHSLLTASCGSSACGCQATEEALSILPLEMEAKHLGVLTVV